MNSRERVLKALDHQEPDRVPLESAFKPVALNRLLKYFEASDLEALRRRLGVDFRDAEMGPAKGFKKSPMDMNYYVTKIDEFGIGREWGATGIHWHFTYHPLQHKSLDEYELPEIDAPGRFDQAKENLAKWKGQYAMVGSAGCGIFEHAWFLRGFREFMRDLYANPDFVNKLFDRLLEWKMEEGKRLIELGVDIVSVGDDLGMQTGLIISPDLWRRYLKPRYRRWFGELGRRGAFVDFHCDGKIDAILPELIECGIDILNPVQPECMDPAQLKRIYGDKLTFKGTVSVQETMPFGTVEDVRNEVITRLDTVGRNGGLILWPRIVEEDVPEENVREFYDAAGKYGQYPLRPIVGSLPESQGKE